MPDALQLSVYYTKETKRINAFFNPIKSLLKFVDSAVYWSDIHHLYAKGFQSQTENCVIILLKAEDSCR